MNAYWLQTHVIEIDEPIVISSEIYGSQKMNWGAAVIVYAESRSQARYVFWRDYWRESTYGQDFEESMNDIKTIRLLSSDVKHEPGIEHFEDSDDYWNDELDIYDYSNIQDPLWAQVAERFWKGETA